MSLPVFFHAQAGAAVEGGAVDLDGDEGRHAVVVKRIRVGEEIELTDGAGVRLRVRVDSLSKSALSATVLERSTEVAPAPTVTVVQAIPKGERAELSVEVLTEIGADAIVPWAASRCVAVWKGERAAKSHARWVATSRAAAKQARRAHWPQVPPAATTSEAAALLAAADVAVVLHESATGTLADVPVESATSLAVVVGPEGGLTDEEVAAFAAEGASVVRLGKPVLRTSTAGVAAVAALLARTGRWR